MRKVVVVVAILASLAFAGGAIASGRWVITNLNQIKPNVRHQLRGNMVVVVMRGSGFTPLEKTMMDSGDPERVVAMRHDFQHMMTKLFTDTIEELTGRKVLAFLSQAHVEPDLSLEIFFIDRPLEGFGAVELVQPE